MKRIATENLYICRLQKIDSIDCNDSKYITGLFEAKKYILVKQININKYQDIFTKEIYYMFDKHPHVGKWCISGLAPLPTTAKYISKTTAVKIIEEFNFDSVETKPKKRLRKINYRKKER